MADLTQQRASQAAVLPYAQAGGQRGYVVLLASVAALGGLLFGYDTAVISGAIPFLKSHFRLNEWWEGFAAASALLGCILGAAFAGAASDRIGRKKALLLSAVFFTLSAVGAAVPRTLTEFVIARVLGGVGVGMASMLSPLYIAEVSPARVRGRLVSMNQLAIISGMLLVYFVNARIAAYGNESWNVSLGWRYMFGSGVLPAMLFFVLLLLVPESPRWLTKQGQSQRAMEILTRVGGPEHAARELAEIQDAIAHEGGSLWDLLAPRLRVPLLIGIGLAILQQITGINTVLYYAPKILESTGRATTDALNATVLIGLINAAFTVVAIWVVDLIGRKPLLLIGSAIMGLALFLLGRAFTHEQFAGPMVLVMLLAYVAAFAVAMGPVVWVIMSEIFPTRIRGRAMSVATVGLWIACFLVSEFFPAMLKHLGGYSFYVYGAMCVIAVVFVAALVPETKGKSLEEIERSWGAEKKAFPVVMSKDAD